MKVYILVGEKVVRSLTNGDWEKFEELITEIEEGDIISWDTTNDISELLDMLVGWNDFIKLSDDDLSDIKNNTKIKID